jgi:hypothetical protein
MNMGEIISLNSSNGGCANDSAKTIRTENDLIKITDGILLDARTDISKKNTISMPIAQLATLGAGVSSLIPALRTVTQTTTIGTQGLYQLANAGVGDALKVAKNGNFWGALKTTEGTSKFAQLQAAGPLSATSTTVMPIDPATMMIAVALFAIEQQLSNIAETTKQIQIFLEVEKESEIEADIETLFTIITKYKFNWDNEHFVASNHKLVLDIQRTARKHMNSYQKKVSEILSSKQLVIAQSKVNSTLKDLQKKFKYYRLSLYTFSMASLVEIMLSGNFKEENISGAKSEIEKLSMEYRDIYGQCSLHLERMSGSSLEANVLKGIGAASNVVGKFIGNIPVIKEGTVDEYLQDSGAQLKKNAINIEKSIVEAFAEISNPGIGVFIEKMNDLIRIYNHTTDVFFDENRIYLVAN